MRVVKFTDPTHPDNCLSNIYASRTFFISKLPHRVGTFRRMGEQESATLYRTHVHILLGLMQLLTAARFFDIHVPEKFTSTLSLSPSLMQETFLPPHSPLLPSPTSSPSLPPSLHLLLTPHSSLLLTPPPPPLPPSFLNPTDPSHSPPAG